MARRIQWDAASVEELVGQSHDECVQAVGHRKDQFSERKQGGRSEAGNGESRSRFQYPLEDLNL